MEKYQPFCDIELDEVICTNEEYDDIVQRMKDSANRDMKFSDTEITVTTLDLHRYLNYRCHFVREDAFRFGVQCAMQAVINFVIKAAIVIALLAAIGYTIYVFSSSFSS